MTRVVVVVALLVAGTAHAQPTPMPLAATEALNSMSRPMAMAAVPAVVVRPEHRRGRRTDAKFWWLGAALNTAMLLDTKSTFDVMARCARCAEGNPLVAPLIDRGPVVAYAVAEAFDLGVMTLAARMRHAERRSVRRLWWVVPAALTAAHAVAYRHNLGVGRD
ncbi:MAG: hypothetical protein ABL961_13545 [Vicinamibacterales bacterium]